MSDCFGDFGFARARGSSDPPSWSRTTNGIAAEAAPTPQHRRTAAQVVWRAGIFVVSGCPEPARGGLLQSQSAPSM